MAKGMNINIVHADGPLALVEIDGKLYWADVISRAFHMAVLPTGPAAASISLIGGQSKPVSV